MADRSDIVRSVITLASLLIASLVIIAQEPERVYTMGEHVGDAVIQSPTVIHEPSNVPSPCKLNPDFRSIGISVSEVIGTDGNVHDANVTKLTVWVRDGDGRTLIDESDPKWKSFASAVEAFKKQVIDYFGQERYRPATLKGEPVQIQSNRKMNVSCSGARR
jgi:hypothetical protein